MKNSWQKDLFELPVEILSECLICEGDVGVVDSGWCKYLLLPRTFGVLRCSKCGLRWLSPRPNLNGYERLYSNAMYFEGKGGAPEDYSRVVIERLSYFRKRVKKISRITGRNALSILDFGAATGDFVSVARNEGHHCEGVELSADARKKAQLKYGITLIPYEDANALGEGMFDVVHMNHVLEHLPNPLNHLLWCRKLLKPNGLLVFEVPNQFDNDLDRLRRWLGVGGRQKRFDAYSLHHTFFFNLNTVNLLLKKSGFLTLKISTFNPDKTPFWPPRAKNIILLTLLGLADRIHNGGNIIEVFALTGD